MYCTNCGNKLDEDALFCTNCGVKLSNNLENRYCFTCGTKFEDDAVFCIKCGRKIKDDETEKEIKIPQNTNSEIAVVEINNAEKLQTQETKTYEKAPVLEYKDISVNGRWFVYLDDTSKVFCPKCHNKADIYSTLCSYCNASFCEPALTESQENQNVFKNDMDKTLSEKSVVSRQKLEDNYGLLVAVKGLQDLFS